MHTRSRWLEKDYPTLDSSAVAFIALQSPIWAKLSYLVLPKLLWFHSFAQKVTRNHVLTDPRFRSLQGIEILK